MTTQLTPPLEVIEKFGAHDGSVTHFFEQRVKHLGDRPMVEFNDEILTWTDCHNQVNHAISWMQEMQINEGDRVGLMSFNHPSTIPLIIACARLGAIVVPCNPDFQPNEAAYIFEHTQVKGVVCSAEVKSKVHQATERIHPRPWVCVNDSDLDSEKKLQDKWLSCSPDLSTYKGHADSTCLIIYTSGTTGFPKGVMHSQKSFLLTGESFVQRMYLQPDERVMCVLPLFHINALMYSLCGAMACGGTLILVRKFSASQFWITAAKTRATEVNVIMSAAAILARRPSSEFTPSHCIRKMFLAPLNQDLLDTFQNKFGVPTLIECYGMTEIPGVLSNPFLGPHKIGSMGKISPHPSPSIKRPEVIVLNDNHEPVDKGQVGELAVKTPTIMQGYYRDSLQTESSFSNGWFLTGDLAWQDDDDFFFFFTRKKDIIRRKGENLSGAEIDSAIASHPKVLECAAMGVPSELGDEELMIAVVKKPGEDITCDEIMAHARITLSPLKRPRYVVLVPELPHTGSLKIAKFKLKPQLKDLLTQAQEFLD